MCYNFQMLYNLYCTKALGRGVDQPNLLEILCIQSMKFLKLVQYPVFLVIDGHVSLNFNVLGWKNM